MQHNGGACLAMAGKRCVAIAADKRFGAGAQTLGKDFQRIFPITNTTYIGITGLGSDVLTL